MPTAGGPNILGESNLVFAYDTGDVKNSYRGEPATNSQNANISSMTQAGFNSWSCYDGSPPYHTWGTNQSKTFVTIPGPFGTSVNAMLYHNFNGGFYGPTDWDGVPNGTITAGRTYTVQGWVKAADSNSIGKTVRPYTYYSHSGGAYSGFTSYTLTDQWQLVSHTHTVQYNATGGGIIYFFTENSSGVKMYLTMTGVFLDKSHPVPWIVGGSTRSNTQGLLPLVGNSTINLSNVSFDSSAKMVFDGTNDYVSLGASSNWAFGGNGTIEMMLKPSNSTGNDRLWCVNNNGTSLDAYLDGTSYNIYMHGGTVGRTTPVTQNTWNHVVVTYSSGTIQIYINGVPGTMAGTTTGYNITNSGTMYLGCYTDLGYNLYGEISIFKTYNRALTAQEVKQNYQQYKTRFNLS